MIPFAFDANGALLQLTAIELEAERKRILEESGIDMTADEVQANRNLAYRMSVQQFEVSVIPPPRK